jgi:putative transposase
MRGVISRARQGARGSVRRRADAGDLLQLVGLRATHCLSDFLRELKSGSSEWAHTTAGRKMFAWQPGYFGSTVSPSQVERVRQYVLGQEEHHRRRSFQDEYLEMLRLSGIQYDERYVW